MQASAGTITPATSAVRHPLLQWDAITADAVRPAKGQLDAGVGGDRRRLEAEHLLIALIEQVLHPAEHLHAPLHLVAGGGIDEPVGVEGNDGRRGEERQLEGAILRWNGCARIIVRNNLEPREMGQDFLE